MAVEWATTRHAPASRACAGAPDAVRTRALAPGEGYSVELDLSDARWHVLDKDKPVEIGALTGFPQFRIEYRVPEAASAPAEAPLWRGRMLTQAFNATGVLD